MEWILLAGSVLAALQQEDRQWYLPSTDVHVLQSSSLHKLLAFWQTSGCRLFKKQNKTQTQKPKKPTAI